jgi:hypothetical protein
VRHDLPDAPAAVPSRPLLHLLAGHRAGAREAATC